MAQISDDPRHARSTTIRSTRRCCGSARRPTSTSRARSWRGNSVEDEHIPAEAAGQEALQKIRLRYLAHKDVARFSRTASFSIFDGGYEQVVSRIMYNVHALEKGLPAASDLRLGFGRKALSDLNDALVVYTMKGYDRCAFAYVARGLRHPALPGAAREAAVRRRLPDRDHRPGVPEDRRRLRRRPGTKIIRRADKERNSEKNFFQLAQGRSSVREFTGQPIDTNKVMNALRNAEKTPSVCNRQGWRVYWVENKELAARCSSTSAASATPRCRRCCSPSRSPTTRSSARSSGTRPSSTAACSPCPCSTGWNTTVSPPSR